MRLRTENEKYFLREELRELQPLSQFGQDPVLVLFERGSHYVATADLKFYVDQVAL